MFWLCSVHIELLRRRESSLMCAVSQCVSYIGFPKSSLSMSFSQPLSVNDTLQVEEDEGEKLLNVIEPPPEKARKTIKTKRKVVKKIIRRSKEGEVQETVLSQDDLVREHSETIVNMAVQGAKKTFSRESLNE